MKARTLTSLSQKLRRNSTEAEKRLWKFLRSRVFQGYKFRRQLPIGNYIVDFCCLEKKLIVELDGGQHALSKFEDEMRTDFLNQEGFRVIRFWDNEVLKNSEGVLEKIKQCIEDHPHPTSPLKGEEISASTLAKGFSLTELMITVAIVGVVMGVGPNLLLNIVKFFRLQMARAEVQKDARTALDLLNRHLRQATASTVVVRNRPNQPPYSWISFDITKGTGTMLGSYSCYQEGTYFYFNNRGSTITVSENLKYLAFTYPKSDNDAIVSISMTFEKATYAGYTKALQLSIEKVRVMN